MFKKIIEWSGALPVVIWAVFLMWICCYPPWRSKHQPTKPTLEDQVAKIPASNNPNEIQNNGPPLMDVLPPSVMKKLFPVDTETNIVKRYIVKIDSVTYSSGNKIVTVAVTLNKKLGFGINKNLGTLATVVNGHNDNNRIYPCSDNENDVHFEIVAINSDDLEQRFLNKYIFIEKQ